MDFQKEYILENSKVCLQPLKTEDFQTLLEFSENEPDIWSYNALGADGAENLKKYIATTLKNKENKIDYPFIVLDKLNGKVIGSTRFYLINVQNKTLEIGFTWYGKKYQGSYINKNCKYLLLEFAFEKLNMERVGFRANNMNKRSINAMKSIGCIEEGVMRSFSLDAKGNRIDVIVLSILKNEWFENVKSNLKKKIEAS